MAATRALPCVCVVLLVVSGCSARLLPRRQLAAPTPRNLGATTMIVAGDTDSVPSSLPGTTVILASDNPRAPTAPAPPDHRPNAFPELMGKPKDVARKTIVDLGFVANVLKEGSFVTFEHNSNRVNIFYNPATNLVTRVPKRG